MRADATPAARRYLRHVRLPLVDVLLAVLLFVTGQYQVWFGELDGSVAANATMVALFCAPLAWRRKRPVAAFAVVAAAAVAHVKIEHQAWIVPTDEGMAQAWFAVLIAFYSVAAHAEPRRAALAGLIGGGAFIANDIPQLVAGATTLDHTVPAWFILGGAWGVGYALRGRQVQVQALADRAARLERQREQAAGVERERIARELHDVVAHSLSVMVIQAQAAGRVLDGPEPSAREALASIDSTGRQALVEMRRLVGMLREGDLTLAPQPGLDQLDVLLGQVRQAGLAVELEVEGDRRPLAPGVDLAAYRIVQEALTNVLKHAGPASARVAVRFRAEEIELEIIDDGTGSGDGPPGGHGLAGMRERIAVYGGALEAASLNGHGFRVRARLPT